MPHGTVGAVRYVAKTLGDARREMYVYTPPGYEKGTGRYPVLYLNHGGGDDPRQFVEEIGLLPLAGSERFAIVAPEHQSAGAILSDALPKLVKHML